MATLGLILIKVIFLVGFVTLVAALATGVIAVGIRLLRS